MMSLKSSKGVTEKSKYKVLLHNLTWGKPGKNLAKKKAKLLQNRKIS